MVLDYLLCLVAGQISLAFVIRFSWPWLALHPASWEQKSRGEKYNMAAPKKGSEDERIMGGNMILVGGGEKYWENMRINQELLWKPVYV